jgi:hypothetical protein
LLSPCIKGRMKDILVPSPGLLWASMRPPWASAMVWPIGHFACAGREHQARRRVRGLPFPGGEVRELFPIGGDGFFAEDGGVEKLGIAPPEPSAG